MSMTCLMSSVCAFVCVYVCTCLCACVCTGDVNSGKSVLVDKICQSSKTKNLIPGHHLSGCCLEYRYFDVRDEETDGEAGMCLRMTLHDCFRMPTRLSVL